jgi:hypothetical protein
MTICLVTSFLGKTPVCPGRWFERIVNCMGRLAQLIRDLFSVKCSETVALSLLLSGGPIPAPARKLRNSEGGLLPKMAAGTFWAIWGAVMEVIVSWKILISRKHA